MTFAEILIRRKWTEIQLSHWERITESQERFKILKGKLRFSKAITHGQRQKA